MSQQALDVIAGDSTHPPPHHSSTLSRPPSLTHASVALPPPVSRAAAAQLRRHQHSKPQALQAAACSRRLQEATAREIQVLHPPATLQLTARLKRLVPQGKSISRLRLGPVQQVRANV